MLGKESEGLKAGEGCNKDSAWVSRLAGILHLSLVNERRVKVLSCAIRDMLPQGDLTGLDVGCGTGEIARNLQELRGRTRIVGVDVFRREGAVIPVMVSDGRQLPFPDSSFHFAMLIDVLHHVSDPVSLLSEAKRVGRIIVVKDHVCETTMDRVCLEMMDWVGNARNGARVAAKYLSRNEWEKLFESCGLAVEEERSTMSLYRWPASLLFERDLHFMARVVPAKGSRAL